MKPTELTVKRLLKMYGMGIVTYYLSALVLFLGGFALLFSISYLLGNNFPNAWNWLTALVMVCVLAGSQLIALNHILTRKYSDFKVVLLERTEEQS